MTPIAGASGPVTIAGTVVAAADGMLKSPITDRDCVCYEVHGSLLDKSRQSQGARDFLVEDASGRALVVLDRYELTLGRLEQGEQLMSVLDADIGTVSGQISDLKVKAREMAANKRREVDAQLREMKGLATLLCAIRAHARGNVHVGKTIEGQAKYIQKNSKKYEDAGGTQQIAARYLKSFDTVLTIGDAVTVSGVASQEPDPTAAGGYRDRATRTVIRAPDEGVVEVSGEGAEAAERALAPIENAAPLATLGRPQGEDNTAVWLVLGVLIAIASVAIAAC